MKSYLLCLVVLISAFPILAQSDEKKIAYLDKKCNIIADPQAAAYYRTVQSADTGYIVRDYFTDGRIGSVTACREYAPAIIRHGKVKNYYGNGNIRDEGSYKENLPVGIFTYFYENGKPEKRLEEGVGSGTRHLQYYTPEGRELLDHGRGILTDTDDGGDTIYSEIEYYEIVSCYKISPAGDTTSLVVEQAAAYPGGIPAMMNYLRYNIKYPKQARKDGVEGTVYVSFIIHKTGKVSELVVVKSVSAECDAEALRVISEFPYWEPGIQRGKGINCRFVLPIKFSLATNKRR
jgi:TonB family protein